MNMSWYVDIQKRYDSSNNNLEPTLTATCSDEHVDDDYVHVKNDVEQTTGIAEEQETVSQKKHHHILILTCTDGGRGIPKSHNAESIHKLHPATTYYHHAHSGHMAHCDNGGGKLAGKLMPDVGTKEGNEQAREAAHTLIKQILTQWEWWDLTCSSKCKVSLKILKGKDHDIVLNHFSCRAFCTHCIVKVPHFHPPTSREYTIIFIAHIRCTSYILLWSEFWTARQWY